MAEPPQSPSQPVPTLVSASPVAASPLSHQRAAPVPSAASVAARPAQPAFFLSNDGKIIAAPPGQAAGPTPAPAQVVAMPAGQPVAARAAPSMPGLVPVMAGARPPPPGTALPVQVMQRPVMVQMPNGQVMQLPPGMLPHQLQPQQLQQLQQQQMLQLQQQQLQQQRQQQAAQAAAMMAARPPPPMQPPVQVQITLEATYGMRSDSGLLLDKRTVVLHVNVLDANGKPTHVAVGLQVVLVYEDMTPMPPELASSCLTGKTSFSITGGKSTVRVRITTTSSNHNRRRFRFKVCPQDVNLAKERPRLSQLSEPFTVLTSTANQGMKAAKKDAAGGLQPQAALAAGAAPNGYAAPTGGNAAPPLTRHRYFPSEELRRATAAPDGKGPPLSRKALGLSDRLAALVAQQVAQRAWTQARRRPLREGEERVLRARDVVSAIRKPGQLDFLFHAGALRRWGPAPADDPQGIEPPPLWGTEPDWATLHAAKAAPEPQPQQPQQPPPLPPPLRQPQLQPQQPPPLPPPLPQAVPAPQPGVVPAPQMPQLDAPRAPAAFPQAPQLALMQQQAESVASAAALAVARISDQAARERSELVTGA